VAAKTPPILSVFMPLMMRRRPTFGHKRAPK